MLGSHLSAGSTESTKDVNKIYLFFNTLTISLGFMQFGVGMNSWSNTQGAFAQYFGWDTKETNRNGDILQSVIILGAAIGALSCSKLLSIGKLRLIFVLNVIIVIGVGISLIGKYVWLMCIGRLIWGFSFGAFSVVSAKMVNEILPVELSGPFGAINQMALCFGAAIPGTFALSYPNKFDDLPTDDFYVSQYFRIMWCVPLVVSAIQVILLLTVFNHETPVYLYEQNREEELLVVMKKFYKGMEVRRRLDMLSQSN
jgi:MFS family permease